MESDPAQASAVAGRAEPDVKGENVSTDRELPPLPEPEFHQAVVSFGPNAAYRSGYSDAQMRARDALIAEDCAKQLDEAADRLAPPGKRTNQVDAHCAEVLRSRAAAIRARYKAE